MEELGIHVQPLVSVLIPIYRVEAYIEKCLISLFEQTYEHIEYVFVDDCSPDESVAILLSVMKRYPHRLGQVKLFRNKENLGISKVRNILLDRATGEYVVFVDSDDWIENSMVKNLVEKALITNADIVCYNLMFEYDGYSKKYEFILSDNKIENLKNISLGTLNTYLPLLFVRRCIYSNNKLKFNTDINLCEDYVMYNFLFCYAKKIVHYPYICYHYYRGNPNSYTLPSLQHIQDRARAIQIVECYLSSIGVLKDVTECMMIRKFLTKKDFIFNADLHDFNQWRSFFPETNSYWRYLNLGFINKIIYMLVSIKFDMLAILFLKIMRYERR